MSEGELQDRTEEASRALSDAFNDARSVKYQPDSPEAVALHQAEKQYEDIKQRRRRAHDPPCTW